MIILGIFAIEKRLGRMLMWVESDGSLSIVVVRGGHEYLLLLAHTWTVVVVVVEREAGEHLHQTSIPRLQVLIVLKRGDHEHLLHLRRLDERLHLV
jgi:hypothetical protein